MKWQEIKDQLSSLSNADKNQLELLAALVTYRKSKGITQNELAERAGISLSEITQMENLNSEAFDRIFLKVASVLGLKLTLLDKSS